MSMSVGKWLATLGLGALALGPMLLLMFNGVIDPFTFNWMASVTESVNDGHIPEHPRYAPGTVYLLAFVSIVSGLDPETLTYFLLNGPVLLITIFVLAKLVIGSSMLAGLATVIVSFAFGAPYYSVWPHGFGFSLFAIVVFCVFKITYRSHTESLLGLLLVIVVAYAGIHFYSYTTEAWALTLFIVIALAMAGYNYYHKSRLATLGSFALAALATTFTFNELLYGGFLTRINPSELLSATQRILARTFAIGSAGVPERGEFAAYMPSPDLLQVLTVGLLVGVTLPLFLDLGRLLYAKHNPRTTRLSLIRLSIASVLIVDVVAYGLLGVIFFRYALFIFPVLALSVVMGYSRSKALRYGFMLAALTITIFTWNWSLDYHVKSSSRFEEVYSIADWYHHRTDEPRRPLIGDHYTLGQFDLIAAHHGRRQDAKFYTVDTFRSLFFPTEVEDINISGVDFVVNRLIADKTTWSGGWFDFEPIKPHLDNVLKNPHAAILYDDGRLWFIRGIR